MTAEMITLVACGHTIGGVHSVDHPEIVITGNVSEANVARFDTTTGTFDNKVVTEYLDDSTLNPLLRNTNDTLNSDKRIFASDGNATMNRLAEPAFYKAQCESLFERMVDLVPADVTLTEPLQPADVRPYIISYLPKGNGTLELAGRIRVRITNGTGLDPDDLTVTLVPADRSGAAVGAEVPAKRAVLKLGTSYGYFSETFQWYEFNTTFAAGASAPASFGIRLARPSDGQSTVYDNGGTGGYPVNPDVLFLRPQSCTFFNATTNTAVMTINVAVSRALLDLDAAAAPHVRLVQKTPQPRNFIPKLAQEVVPLARTGRETAEYVYFQAQPVVGRVGLQTSFDVEVGESKLIFQETGEMAGRTCAAF